VELYLQKSTIIEKGRGKMMRIEVYIMIGVLIVLALINKKRKGFTTGEMTVMAILVALASAVRVVLMAIPNAKPTSFIIICAGQMMGSGAGFIVGCLVALISNLFLGIGPWLPWQMALWGLMGFMSPMIKGKNRLIQAVYGFAWGMVFGWVMNLWYYTAGKSFSIQAYIFACVNSFSFDITHAVMNAILLLVFSTDWLEHIMKIARSVNNK